MTATLQQEKKDTPDKLITNCPFYGTAYYEGSPRGTPHPPFVLFPSGGNQCAMVTNRLAPCYLEMDGLPVDWRACRIVRHMRMERDDE